MPVFNEEAALERSVRRLHGFLTDEFPFSWRIVVADNAAPTRTPADRRPAGPRAAGRVACLRLERKGRGRALRAAWSRSAARVVCYMDVDLSTDLRALLPLVAPLLSGHSDLAIGTRLAHGAPGGARAQARADLACLQPHPPRRAARPLLAMPSAASRPCGPAALRRACSPTVRDDGWFFDTELLVLAQRRGLRIHEVPVDWVDDPDSRVASCARRSTTCAAWRGWRPPRRWRGSSGVGVRSARSRSRCCSSLLRGPLGAGGANAVALAVTAVGNTAANRRFTFRLRGRTDLLRHHAARRGGLRAHAGAVQRCARRPAPHRRHAGAAVELTVLVPRASARPSPATSR